MRFLDVEDFDEAQRGTRRVIIITSIVFVALVAGFFLFLVKPYSKRGPTTNQRIDVSFRLKLSANEIGFLGNFKSKERINVTVMESKEKVYRAKLAHRIDSSTDFQLEIDNVIYNLFMLHDKRGDIYNYFKLASLWGIETSETQTVEIKINGVPIGNYIMEREVFEQIRDADKNYFVSLGANTYRLRKILHFVKNGDANLLTKYFDLDRLASYMVYFSLFSLQQPLDFSHMVFHFNTPKKSYLPFLTVKSALSCLENHGIEFKNHDEYNFLSYRGLDHKNIKNLLDKASNHKFKELIEIVLSHAIRNL